IRTPTNQRRYDIDSVFSDGISSRVTALYCRVSSAKQKEDLNRQISYLQGIYPPRANLQRYRRRTQL
ncbi:MAG TPA: hypothetical protein VIQ31_30360, partial [Phormidium sp.]